MGAQAHSPVREVPVEEIHGPARMTGASTTREDVERLATDLCDPCATMVSRIHAAATLRALLDERDELDAVNDQAVGRVQDLLAENAALAAERDAARADVERMREALEFTLPFAGEAKMRAMSNAPLRQDAYDRWAADPNWIALKSGVEKARAALRARAEEAKDGE